MMIHEMRTRHGRHERGSALVIAMLFMALFSGLAVAYLTSADTNLRNARLYADSKRAQVAAESGLAFMRLTLPTVEVQSAATKADTLQAIATGLNGLYTNTLFAGQTAQVQGDYVILPAVVLNFPEGQTTFQARVHALSDTSYQIESQGCHGEASRASYVDFNAVKDTSLLATFGVASKSRITMTGNAGIVGRNDPAEGSVLSTTYSYTTAISLTGNIGISGDVSITNPLGQIATTGNITIGGDTNIGVSEPVFPTCDTSDFRQYATNLVRPGTPTSGNRSFENIRIQANTNPTFTGNTTIRGVVYIESPNRVTFAGNTDIIGVVVSDMPTGTLNTNTHYLKFTGNVTSNGVGALPAGAQFDGLRDQQGSFILAPGYHVEFTGNFSSINGSIIASKMGFTGNARGTVKGCVLNDRDTDFSITGNSQLTIDHAGMNDNPAGMVFPRRMVYVAGSYEE